MLLGKARAAGWRVMVRGAATERMAWLDEKLWLGDEQSFLPHGMEGGPHDALQPVLLGVAEAAPEGINCLIAVDGATVSSEETQRLDRVCVLFDGNDADALDKARGQWKALSDAKVVAEYWSEETGAWQMKASSEGRVQ